MKFLIFICLLFITFQFEGVTMAADVAESMGTITRDLEHSLDLQSATCGSRIVTAQEQEVCI